MDPYEYLFKKLDIQITDNIDRKYDMPYREIWFKKQKVDVFSSNIIAKNIFQYYNSDKLPSGLRPTSDLIQLLNQFPVELESEAQVDVLLTLNGMNKDGE